MNGTRRIIRVLTALLGASLLVGCAAPEPGWQRLWPLEWDWHHHDQHWVRGVAAAGKTVDVDRSGMELRFELLNASSTPATVRLEGRLEGLEWRLGVGESRAVAEELAPGSYSFSGPVDAILGSPRIGRPLPSPRLVVIVLVDTLRADHVTPELMPGVARSFEEGRRWLQATANCSWTLPSVASMFTARPVLELSSPEGDLIGIPEGMPTWATRLGEAGFEGGGVVANYTIHALNGFARGFSSYLVPDGHGTEEHPDGGWVVDEARRWLAAHDGEDAFLYLHLMDPHEPYRSHADPDITAPDLEPLAMRRREASADEAEVLRALYAAEVRHVDKLVARFLAELPEDAVVVFTSDHGEALGEHGAWGHGLNLYQEALAVPLLVRAPSVAVGEVAEPVQLLDLGPTVLELCGVAPADDMAGRSLLSGGSPEPLVSTTFGGGPLRWAWREDNHKTILRMAAQPGLGAIGRTRLSEGRPLPAGAFHFDLATDPGENYPGPIPPDLLGSAGTAFARSAGRMVPGLQLLAWGGDGPATPTIEMAGEVEIVQAWSTAPITVARAGERFELRCGNADPLCAVAVAPETVPETVAPITGGLPWQGLVAGRQVAPRELSPPAEIGCGSYLWWNPDRPLVVGGYDETLERLRALGYID